MMEVKKEVRQDIKIVNDYELYTKNTDVQPMDMMPTASLMEQDAFKRTPVSSASLTAAATNNMLTPSQPPKVLYVPHELMRIL